MTLTFRLRFYTHYGQNLFLMGNHPFFGNNDPAKALPLKYLDPDHSEVTVELPELPKSPITYNYLLREPDGSLIYDWGSDKTIRAEDFTTEHVLLLDSWNNASYVENAFYTVPFLQVLLKSNFSSPPIPEPPHVTHRFRVKAPLLGASHSLGLVNSSEGWNTTSPILLNRSSNGVFLQAEVDFSKARFPLEYKYAVYDAAQKRFLHFEAGENRRLERAPDEIITQVNDGFARLSSTTWRGTGVAIPVFSLRSQSGFGIGEFSDIKLLANWCKRTGLKLIQLLPVNDTSATHTWTDSYPYAAISAFALHPIYIDLKKVISERNKGLLDALEQERQRLNLLDAIDYESVLGAKLAFLRQVYPLEKNEVFSSDTFKEFLEHNRAWLVPYAAFCRLRDRFGTSNFTQWPELAEYDPAAVNAMAEPTSTEYDELAFYFFVQFQLHLQLQDATHYAHELGVVLKGDIPIGIYRYGADAWQNPELYNLHLQAGAPPDAFAAKGQNWGFPTYNWKRMEETGFAWWKQRFEQMGHYFDAFRIDHILGFFRIWTIPMHAVEGILGHFEPAIPVHVNEFDSRGIPFDRYRYTAPYITESVLGELFGPATQLVKDRFLDSDAFGNFRLKPEFATQRQVERYFQSLPPDDSSHGIKQGLFDLISNVLLLEVEGSDGQQYHFRFGIDQSLSFRALDPQTQRQLYDLYVDYFFRRQEDFWMKEAMEKLPHIKRVTNMLICGEDLGLVPSCVPVAMKDLGILSLEIQRMPKELGREFSRPVNAPYLSVVTPSSHDVSTIRGWWKEDHNLTQKFYSTELKLPGEAPSECSGGLNRAIVRQHLASPAMWSIFQLQDLLGMDETLRRKDPDEERINVPAIPNYYWRYRMHLTLEQLLAADKFNDSLKQDILDKGR